jgi:hypothetical protein
MYSDLDVGKRLLSRFHLGCVEADEIVGQLRMYPLLQVSEFLRSWILVNFGLEETDTKTTHRDDDMLLVPCTSESLIQLMIRGLEIEAEKKARAAGSFSQFRHVKQLPSEVVLAIFGHVRSLAIHTAFFREFILNNINKRSTPPLSIVTTVTAAAEAAAAATPSNENLASSSLNNEKLAKKRALGVITTDASGYVELDKLVPRKKKKPTKPSDNKHDLKKQVGTTTSSSTSFVVRGDAGYITLLEGMCVMSTALSEHDANPFMPDGEAIWVMSCQRAALDTMSSLSNDQLFTPPWNTIAQWIHPKRFDLAQANRKKSLSLASIAANEQTDNSDSFQ